MKSVLIAALATTALLSLYFVSGAADTLAAPSAQYSREFMELIESTELTVATPSDLDYRYGIYLKNKQFIAEVNKRGNSYTLGVTPNVLYTFEEFTAKYSLKPFGEAPATPIKKTDDGKLTARKVDWRGSYDKTEVRNQTISCNAGYAIAAAGVVEAFVQKFRGESVPLSPQQIIDCSTKYNNNGCVMGLAENALNYIKDNGIATENNYRYVAASGKCRSVDTYAGLQNGFSYAKSEGEIKRALGSLPIVVAFVTNEETMHYTGGVYVNHNCGPQLNQFALAVGYAEGYSTPDFWILKNSFGKRWGDLGYMYLETNSCGVVGNNNNVYVNE